MKSESGGRRQESARARAEAQVEVETHLSLQIADLVAAGWSEEAARAEALRRFGDRSKVESEMVAIDASVEASMRRVRLLRDVMQDVRRSVRQFVVRPWFSLVAVGILGLGIGSNVAVFSLVDGALFRPLPFPSDASLVHVYDVQRGDPGYPASLAEVDDWRREFAFASSLMSVTQTRYTLTGEGAAGLLVRSLTNLLNEDKGFDATNMLTFGLNLPASNYDEDRIVLFYDDLLARLRTLPGVVEASATSHLPLGEGDTHGSFGIVGREFADGE